MLVVEVSEDLIELGLHLLNFSVFCLVFVLIVLVGLFWQLTLPSNIELHPLLCDMLLSALLLQKLSNVLELF